MAEKRELSTRTVGLRASLSMTPAEPLWKRVPSHDESGRPLADFMLIIPALGRKPEPVIRDVVERIEGVFQRYGDTVVFTDLNLRTNVLWVSVRPIPGICLELAGAVQDAVPEALLVGSKHSLD